MRIWTGSGYGERSPSLRTNLNDGSQYITELTNYSIAQSTIRLADKIEYVDR